MMILGHCVASASVPRQAPARPGRLQHLAPAFVAASVPRRQKGRGHPAVIVQAKGYSKEANQVGMQLQKSLSSATDFESVLELTAAHAAELDHIHVSTAFHRAVSSTRAAPERERLLADARFDNLSQQLTYQFPKLDAQGVSNVFWGWSSLAPARLPSPELWKHLRDALANERIWLAAKPQAVSNTAWGYVRLCSAMNVDFDREALRGLATRAGGRAGEFKPQEASNLLWALGSSQTPAPKALVEELAQSLYEKRQQCNAQDLGNGLWALGRLKYDGLPREYLDDLLKALAKLSFDDRAVSNALWACAVLDGRPRPSPESLTEFVSAAEGKLMASSQSAAVAIWALAKLRHDPGPKFVARAIAVVCNKASSLRPIDVAQTLWSSVELGYLPGDKSRSVLVGLVERDLGQFNAQQLNMVAYALSRMDARVPEQLGAKLVERVKAVVVGKPEYRQELKTIDRAFKELGLPRLIIDAGGDNDDAEGDEEAGEAAGEEAGSAVVVGEAK